MNLVYGFGYVRHKFTCFATNKNAIYNYDSDTYYIATSKTSKVNKENKIQICNKKKEPVTKTNHNFINITHKFAASLLISFKFEKKIFFSNLFSTHICCVFL